MKSCWIAGATGVITTGAATGAVWLDFDGPRSSGDWQSPGNAVTVEVAAPPAAECPDRSTAPTGRALRNRGDQAGNAVLEPPRVPAAITNACTLRFRALRAAPENAPLEIEAHFFEPDHRSLFWRKVVLDRSGW